MKSYNSLEEINEYLRSNGFTQYEPPPIGGEHVTAFYQKRYTDRRGIMYFLDAKIYDFTWTEIIPEKYIIEYCAQLCKFHSCDHFDVTFIDWNLSKVEEYIDDMFTNNMVDYYELK